MIQSSAKIEQCICSSVPREPSVMHRRKLQINLLESGKGLEIYSQMGRDVEITSCSLGTVSYTYLKCCEMIMNWIYVTYPQHHYDGRLCSAIENRTMMDSIVHALPVVHWYADADIGPRRVAKQLT